MKKYFYGIGENKIVCVSTFAGKAIRGVAKCDPDDTFNIEDGKKLAYARCDVKVAEKRLQFAKKRFEEATIAHLEAKKIFESRQSRYEAEVKKLEEAKAALEKIETSLN